MPIYEFYCNRCNMVFSFFSRKISTEKKPPCPKCRKPELERQVSLFSATGRAAEGGEGMDDLPIDETRMEKAMDALAGEAEGLNEDDPRQAANLMRKFSDMTGVKFGSNMEEALGRLEAGEDPEAVEKEMGDMLDGDESPFEVPGGGGASGGKLPPPGRDETLYEM